MYIWYGYNCTFEILKFHIHAHNTKNKDKKEKKENKEQQNHASCFNNLFIQQYIMHKKQTTTKIQQKGS